MTQKKHKDLALPRVAFGAWTAWPLFEIVNSVDIRIAIGIL